MIADARTLDGHADLSDEQREAVDYWLRYDGEAARLCGEIRDWPGRAEALLAGMPPPDAELDAPDGMAGECGTAARRGPAPCGRRAARTRGI